MKMVTLVRTMTGVGLAMLAMVLVVGCASGVDYVEPDDELQAKLDRYDVEEREVRFSAAGIDVYGTLTVPQEASATPGVVLVAGSGPTDRDWNNPLLPGDDGTAIELADRLAGAGIAVLRYDKRGTGLTEATETVRWHDYLEEVEAAVETLADKETVDDGQVFVAGHSEGGTHALRAASEDRIDVAGVLLLATAGRSMERLVIDQVTDQLSEAGLTDDARRAELASLERALELISDGERVDAHRVSDIPGLVSLVDTLQQSHAHEFAAELLVWDPIRAVGRLDTSLLILMGRKDTQIDVERDARRLYEGASGEDRRVQLALLDDADHVLKHQPGPRGNLSSQHSLTYNDPGRDLDDEALEAIVTWIYDTL